LPASFNLLAKSVNVLTQLNQLVNDLGINIDATTIDRRRYSSTRRANIRDDV